MKINGNPVFPLEKAVSKLRGYYIDQHRNIWSTRGPKAIPRMLKGWRSGDHHYFTLNGSPYSKVYLLDRVRVGSDAGRSFLEEGCHRAVPVAAAPVEETTSPGLLINTDEPRSHANTVADGIKAKGWIIATVEKNVLIFGSNPIIHTTKSSVRSEMTRLATLNPRKQFISLKVDEAVIFGGMLWS